MDDYLIVKKNIVDSKSELRTLKRKPYKETARAKIQTLEEYLSNGGEITKLPPKARSSRF